MEAFSLLKYWRGGGHVASNRPPPPLNATSAAATVLSAVVESHDDDDGPFFDLEFSPHDTNDSSTSGDDDENDDVEVSQVEEDEEEDNDDDVEEGEEEGEFNFTVSSRSSNDRTDDPNLTMSPTDDLFFKGKLVPIESDVFNSAEPNSKALFSGTLLKSATKFRVFMSGLKKSKSNIINAPKNTDGSQTEQLELVEEKRQETTTKLRRRRVSTVKLFKVEEVPIVSLFTRDNSSRISAKSLTGQRTQIVSDEAAAAATEEKRFSKEVVQKYLKMVKPLYVSVSKRKTNRPATLSGQLSFPAEGEAVATETAAAERSSGNNVRGSLMKQGNIPAGLRVVCKHLGKSRSASSAVEAAPPGTVTSQRRDDSLLQQQDGIQSAILHCKRSFNASRDSGLSRSESVSSPSDESREV